MLSERMRKERFYGACAERAGEWAARVAKLERVATVAQDVADDEEYRNIASWAVLWDYIDDIRTRLHEALKESESE